MRKKEENEKRTERIVFLATKGEKKQLEEEANKKNTIISLLIRKKLFDKRNEE